MYNTFICDGHTLLVTLTDDLTLYKLCSVFIHFSWRKVSLIYTIISLLNYESLVYVFIFTFDCLVYAFAQSVF